MGTLYYVGCYDCMVYRDLDKYYTLFDTVETRADALELRNELDTFRATLLVSFMGKHSGHKCTVFSEHDSAYYDFDPDYDDKNVDHDFWDTTIGDG